RLASPVRWVWFPLRPGTPGATGRVGSVEVARALLGPAALPPLGGRVVLVFLSGSRMAGSAAVRTLGAATAASRSARSRAGSSAPAGRPWAGGGGFVGTVFIVVRPVDERGQLRDDAAEQGLRLRADGCVGFAVGVASGPVCHSEVPPDQADQQHDAGGAQHQREPFDERIAAVDQKVFELVDLAAMEQ